jgi:hypothetical protein
MCQDNKLKIYSGFVQAFKRCFEGMNIIINTTTSAITIKAYSLDEAMGKAHRYSKERYPTEKGYYNHNCDMIEVDYEKL